MPATLLLSPEWDLTLDADGNIAVATEPLALAQDAASAIKTFLGECWWDTTIGIPYDQQVLGHVISLAPLKAMLQDAALTVPNVASARVFITDLSDRNVAGQVQVIAQSTGQFGVANFAVSSPQGVG